MRTSAWAAVSSLMYRYGWMSCRTRLTTQPKGRKGEGPRGRARAGDRRRGTLAEPRPARAGDRERDTAEAAAERAGDSKRGAPAEPRPARAGDRERAAPEAAAEPAEDEPWDEPWYRVHLSPSPHTSWLPFSRAWNTWPAFATENLPSPVALMMDLTPSGHDSVRPEICASVPRPVSQMPSRPERPGEVADDLPATEVAPRSSAAAGAAAGQATRPPSEVEPSAAGPSTAGPPAQEPTAVGPRATHIPEPSPCQVSEDPEAPPSHAGRPQDGREEPRPRCRGRVVRRSL